jgi:hypothetical protein
MKTQVVIAVVDIRLAGEYKHFEVRIPDNIKNIEAIESSIRIHSEIWDILDASSHVTINKSFTIGDLRLHGGKYNNWFYSNTLSECLTQYKENLSALEQNALCFQPIVYSKKKEADNCNMIPIGTRIKGYFKDVLGTNLQTDIHYSITISIHLNTT